MPDINRYRTLFPICASRVFLNHAAIAPPSLRVVTRMHDFMRECAEQGARNDLDWQQRLQQVRILAARLTGGSAADMALVNNTSSALSLVAEAFPWRPGDAVLVPTPDFPSNMFPWLNLQRRGVEVITVPRLAGRIDRQMLSRALTPRTRMLALSSVYYAGGEAADLQDIGAFCREEGIFFVVDAIQSLGALPIDVVRCGIHALACGGHKWLLGPMGTGLLYVEPELRRQLHSPLVGWKSTFDAEQFSGEFKLRDDAAVFEPGTLDMSALFGLGAALELLEEIGPETVRRRIFSLLDDFTAGLQAHGMEISSLASHERSGILCFKPPTESPEKMFQALLAQGIDLSLRNGRLRISPHFYNDSSDLHAFFEALKTVI